ncbi:MAG: hypothetical protein ABW360_19110 [Phenylobacterium sp.]
MTDLTLPPSITLRPTAVGVAVFTANGVSVEVSLPRSHGLHDLPDPELVARARRMALEALATATETLSA